MTKNALNDLSQLCGVQEYNLVGLSNQFNTLISHYMFCLKNSVDNKLEVDIGIGTIVFILVNNEVKYKFIPSKNLEKSVIEGCKADESVLIKKANQLIGQRINKTYKELL